MFEYNMFYDEDTMDDPPDPSELTIFTVLFLDDHLIVIKANVPDSNIIMTDSLNAWIHDVVRRP